jgi:hypothetical protein
MVGGDNIRGDYFRFGLVFIKKSNQTEIFFKKNPKPNRNRVKPTGFGFFRAKTGSNRFGSVFSVFFSGFGLVFPVLAWFGSVFFGFFGSVRFFRFFAYKTEIEPNRLIFLKF